MFIFDNNEGLQKQCGEIKISYKLKDEIIIFLNKIGINYRSIYPDNEGLYNKYFEESKMITFIKGKKLFDQKRYVEAIEKYKKVISINPKNKLAYINWGVSLNELKRYKEAIEKYEKVISLNFNNESIKKLAYYNWEVSLNGLEKHKEAIENMSL